MGILSIFSRDPGQRVQALRKKIQERYGQPEGRQQAMDKLLDMGTPEAIAGALQFLKDEHISVEVIRDARSA